MIMSSANQSLSKATQEHLPSGQGKKIAILISEWNKDINTAMLEASKNLLVDNKVSSDDILEYWVPGAFELPAAAKMINAKHNPDAIICLGCVITGETKHDEYISNAVAHGIMSLSIGLNKPVIFGVITPRTKEQAEDRAGGKHGNKGVEAAATALKMLNLKKELDSKKKSIGF